MAFNRHQGIGNSLTIILSVLLSLCFVEFVLAVFPKSKRNEMDDPLLGVRPVVSEGSSVTSWRNEEVLDDVDFVAIGDSFTFGIHAKNASETWPGILGAL